MIRPTPYEGSTTLGKKSLVWTVRSRSSISNIAFVNVNLPFQDSNQFLHSTSANEQDSNPKFPYSHPRL